MASDTREGNADANSIEVVDVAQQLFENYFDHRTVGVHQLVKYQVFKLVDTRSRIDKQILYSYIGVVGLRTSGIIKC